MLGLLPPASVRDARPIPDPAASLAASFDGDSLGFDPAETSFAGSQFRIKGAITFSNAGSGNPEQWSYGARLDGATGRDLTVRVDLTNLRGVPNRVQHWGVWTLDPDGDLQYPLRSKSAIIDNRITLQFDRPVPRKRIYISRWWFYPFSRIARDVARWAESPFVTSPPSATLGLFVAGLTTARANYNGRTIPSLPLYSMRITDPASSGPKSTLVLISGNHAGESAGRFIFAGAVDFLLGNDPQAQLIREYVDTYIYPCINPQGVHGLYFRSTPQHPLVDHNRDWDTAANQSIQLTKAAITADTGGTINALLDYHSMLSIGPSLPDIETMSTPWIEVGWRSNDAWASALSGYHPIVVTPANPIAGSSRGWIGAIAGEHLRLSVTVEESTIDTKGIADHRAYGVATMRALADLVTSGAFPGS